MTSEPTPPVPVEETTPPVAQPVAAGPPQRPWPPEWARSVAFLTGLGLMVWETVIDQAAHLIVYGPAFALTGLPLARGVELLVDKLSAIASNSKAK